jgi:hypothetical protein
MDNDTISRSGLCVNAMCSESAAATRPPCATVTRRVTLAKLYVQYLNLNPTLLGRKSHQLSSFINPNSTDAFEVFSLYDLGSGRDGDGRNSSEPPHWTPTR